MAEHPQHGYYSYDTATTAIDDVAQAWVNWRVAKKIGSRTVTDTDAEFFSNHLKATLPGGWWLTWSRREQEAFLQDMEGQRDKFQTTGLARTTQLPSPVGGASSVTLDRMLKSYGRIVYLAKQLSIFVPEFNAHLVGIDALGQHLYGQPLLTKAEYDGEHYQHRQAVAGQLQRPQLRNPSNSELLALVQMLERIHGREVAGGAHSLAHRSAGRLELSPRQQVVYGRRLAGF
ncbi:hypothetical protein JCM9279_006459 [Rhodotorula babjevae]